MPEFKVFKPVGKEIREFQMTTYFTDTLYFPDVNLTELYSPKSP
jgi:hypothetical protein